MNLPSAVLSDRTDSCSSGPPRRILRVWASSATGAQADSCHGETALRSRRRIERARRRDARRSCLSITHCRSATSMSGDPGREDHAGSANLPRLPVGDPPARCDVGRGPPHRPLRCRPPTSLRPRRPGTQRAISEPPSDPGHAGSSRTSTRVTAQPPPVVQPNSNHVRVGSLFTPHRSETRSTIMRPHPPPARPTTRVRSNPAPVSATSTRRNPSLSVPWRSVGPRCPSRPAWRKLFITSSETSRHASATKSAGQSSCRKLRMACRADEGA